MSLAPTWALWPKICAFVLCSCFLYIGGLCLYRLFWHPLAAFPGPKIAAVSNFYGIYHDLYRSGQLPTQMPKLHDIYGPVVRVGPNEVHIRDIDSYYQVFKQGTAFYKDWSFYNSRAFEHSTLNILDTPSARSRKEAYIRLFSRESISKLEPRINAHIDRFINVLYEAGTKRQPVDLSQGFKCLTADVIFDFMFQEDFGGLRAKDFHHPLIAPTDDIVIFAEWGFYFRAIFHPLEILVDYIPDSILRLLFPPALGIKTLINLCTETIQKLRRTPLTDPKMNQTVFGALLNPTSSKSRPITDDAVLTSESTFMLLAGVDTTANTLVTAVYAMLRNPEMHRKLVNELTTAFPGYSGTGHLAFESLHSLPYLDACIKEALRLSYGAPGKLPRVVPSTGHVAAGSHIPAGSIVGHSSYTYQTDDTIFPSATKFIPERWLTGDTKEMERHLIPFSKGSRSCVGIHLAYTELFITLAKLMLSVNMKVWKTTAQDMTWMYYSVTVHRGHLKVLIEGSRNEIAVHSDEED